MSLNTGVFGDYYYCNNNSLNHLELVVLLLLSPPPCHSMASKLIVKNWIQRLLPACDGDAAHAKRQLEWLKEKVALDVSGNSSKSIYSLSKQEQDQLDTYITQRTEQHKPLQYILGTQPFCELDIVTRPPTLIPRYSFFFSKLDIHGNARSIYVSNKDGKQKNGHTE